MRAPQLLLSLALAACRPPGAGTSETATSTTTAAASSSTTGPVDACERSSECDTEDTEGICVAVYMAVDTLGGERGPATCEGLGACIEELDLGRWCFDHPGCCEGLRCRAVDGICERPTLGQDTDTDGTDSDASTSSTSATTDATTSATTDATTGSSGATDSDTGTSAGTTTTTTGG